MQKDHSITNMRVIATLAVILLHVSADWINNSAAIGTTSWMIANFICSITRWCVPLFFMISGATLLGKQETYKDFYKKRLSKICIPFLFWALFYSAFNVYYYDNTFTMLVVKFFNTSFYHLWFIYALVGIYLVTPLIRKALVNFTKKDLEVLLLFWAISSLGIPFIERMFTTTISLELPFVAGYAGYFILGYYLYQHKPKISLWWFLVGYLVTALGTNYYSEIAGVADGRFYSYFSIPTFLMSISLFSFLQRHPISIPTFSFFSSMSFGIYFIHAGIEQQLNIHFDIASTMGNPLWTIPYVFALCLVISTLLTYIISRIPYLKKVI